MALLGIDVSSHNTLTTVDGIGYVIAKATEGTNYVNPKHDAQVALARLHSVKVGHYHFLTPGNVDAQVSHFIRNAKIASGDLVAVDAETEDPDGPGPLPDIWQGYSWAYRAASTAAFITKVNAAVRARCLWYTNKYWLDNTTNNAAHTDQLVLFAAPLWIAWPGTAGKPGITRPWVMHQYAVSGGLDRNYFTGDWASLAVNGTLSNGEELDVDVVNPLTNEKWSADKALWSIWYYAIHAYLNSQATLTALGTLATEQGLDGQKIEDTVKASVTAALADLKITFTTNGG